MLGFPAGAPASVSGDSPPTSEGAAGGAAASRHTSDTVLEIAPHT